MAKTIRIFCVFLVFLFGAACSDGQVTKPVTGPTKSVDEKPSTDTPKVVGLPWVKTSTSSNSIQADVKSMSKEQRTADAQTLISFFEKQYAPIEWKEEYLEINFDDLGKNLLAAAGEDLSDQEFYDEMIRYLASFKDSHVQYEIPSSLSVHLGFNLDYVEDKIVVADVDRDVLKNGAFPVERGDELVKFDGKGVKEVQDELMMYADLRANEVSQRRIATFLITNRMQSTIPFIPQGEVAMTFKKKADGKEVGVKLDWIAYGNSLAQVKYSTQSEITGNSGGEVDENAKNILDTIRNKSIDLNKDVANFIYGDNVPPFFPLWDNFKIKRQDPMISGEFQAGDKKIGFIRLHTWKANPETFLKAIAEDVIYFEKNTDALIIDQTYNHGGYACLSEATVSFFITTQTETTRDRIRVTREGLANFENLLESTDEKDEDYATIQNIVDNVRTSLETGELLSAPVSLCQFDNHVEPYITKNGQLIAYTKPILLLVNEFTVSAGDTFAAIMQDNGIATLFGSRTNGAGGFVEHTSPIGYSELRTSYTLSLSERKNAVKLPDGTETKYIEGVGVTPDIEYDITLDDFVGGYQGYKKIIEKAVIDLINSGKGKRTPVLM